MTSGRKRCPCCEAVLPLTAFDVNPDTGDYYLACQVCAAALLRWAARRATECRNPRSRLRCTVEVTNQKRRLCASCTEHERYLARSTRRTNA